MLGAYGDRFGAPRFSVSIEGGILRAISVLRGAPCGATWEAAQETQGCPAAEAPLLIGLKTQMHCVADPSAWDPIGGKSPVHIAGEIHRAAMIKALAEKYTAGG